MDRILMYYLRVSQHLSQQFRTHLGKLELTFPQALALSTLNDQGPMPISKLAELTGSANSTISGVVDRLERLGLAKRKRSELDRRVIYVEATEKYRRLQDRAEAGVNEYFDQLLAAQLTDGERKTVAEGLQLLDKALTAGEEEAAGKKSKK
ncbi:MarR family winged helix-turn-helix transcriptional regulator [Vermiculatibacterium agrestimuris]|uniref:MarR family winged helix-turn-helix transcriptional regulator n=1 Tax=Vermiculatibacterium agrestimuris TaxID=2941519 RepID=UPI00203D820F|nr:MarR family transcriptional regulator [Vermiculatibacterium agrestimuris]